MKFRISLAVLTLVLAASSTLTAHAGCTNATIKGSYSFTIHGQVLLQNGAVLLIDGLARTTYDGEGNVTQLDAVAANGGVAPGWRVSTGTYSLSSNCTGTMTVTNGDQPLIHTQLIVSQSGNTIRDMVMDPGFASTAEGERIHLPRN